MIDRIMTLHPNSEKRGVNINREKYEIVSNAVLDTIRKHGEMDFSELVEALQAQLGDRFEGSIPWYVTTVKLDLEARRMIERIPGSSPQRLRIPG